jgi:pimeloyl-ACP methyl ester carboxylesterase
MTLLTSDGGTVYSEDRRTETERILTIRVLALAALAFIGAACGGHSTAKTRSVPGEPGLEYDARGSYLYLLCVGHGSPTVILEAGLGGDHRDWYWVQPEIARTTRVCSYDRSGLEFSQLAPKRATARAKVNDLHELLAAANVKGPYVLVGHSYGGMLVRVYADAYPRDVVGVVLLDSSHPDQANRSLAALPPRRPGEAQELRDLRTAFRSLLHGPNPEGVDWKMSTDEARAAGPLGDKPLLVVTAGEEEWTGPTPLPGIDRRLKRTWIAMQDELARQSTDSVHVIANYSPHFVMSNLGQPDLVIRAVRAVVTAAQSHARLPRCRDLFAAPAATCIGS